MNSQNSDFRKQFAGTASGYRKRHILLSFLFVPLLLLFWYVVVSVPQATSLVVLTFGILFVAVLLGRRTIPKLICPGCKRDTDCAIVRFCPECGSAELRLKGEDGYFLVSPRCQACGKELGRKTQGRRLYKICFCTRCGAYLDEDGI
jgi:hypothetical protein